MLGGVRANRAIDLEALRFRPRRMVRWLSPPRLVQSGAEVVISGLFGKFADKRELQTWDQQIFRYEQGKEIWLDYASDVGDGFDSTYSIAWLLARDELKINRRRLPRGKVLLLGGDEVYPSAGREEYEDHFIGPYSAALPHSRRNREPHMYAVPGNHDWYDGLTSFLRVFCQERWIGGWRTRQRRSYFALRLPRPWWLWAIDIQFDTEIDEVQLEYFRRAAEAMTKGRRHRLILLTAKPSWVTTEYEPESYRNLAYVERNLVPPHVDLVATLTGDIHHYSRYELAGDARRAPRSVPSQRITAGGGGAYVSATHTLPPRTRLPRLPWKPDSEEDDYRQVEIYPSEERSRRLSWGALLAPLRTPLFAALLAAVYALFAATMLGALDARTGHLAELAHGDGWIGLLADSIGGTSVVVALLLVVTLVGFADFRNPLAKVVAGLLHAALHLAAVAAAVWAITRALGAGTPDVFIWGAVIGVPAIAGAVVGTMIFGIYLFATHRIWGGKVPGHTNQAFAGQAIPDYKCFLRLRVERDGPVTIYPIKVEEACRRWRLTRDEGDRPTIQPRDPPGPRAGLIEEPIVLGTRSTAGSPPPRGRRRRR